MYFCNYIKLIKRIFKFLQFIAGKWLNRKRICLNIYSVKFHFRKTTQIKSACYIKFAKAPQLGKLRLNLPTRTFIYISHVPSSLKWVLFRSCLVFLCAQTFVVTAPSNINNSVKINKNILLCNIYKCINNKSMKLHFNLFTNKWEKN